MQCTDIEKQLHSEGFGLICGIDEAGRGPLAGPVVAASVIIPEDFSVQGIKDSKKMTDRARRSAYPEIISKSLAYGFGIVGPKQIDASNILEATKQAMIAALQSLNLKPDYILSDAVKLEFRDIPVMSMFKGEDKSSAIAAASVLAKVKRDDIMLEADREYPQYEFRRHKGYGTVDHLLNIALYGPSTIHRMSFEPVKSQLRSPEFYMILKKFRQARTDEKLDEAVNEVQSKRDSLSSEELSDLRDVYISVQTRLRKKSED